MLMILSLIALIGINLICSSCVLSILARAAGTRGQE